MGRKGLKGARTPKREVEDLALRLDVVVLTCSYDGTAKLWCCETGECFRTFSRHADAVMSATFSLDGARVLTAGLRRRRKDLGHIHWCV